MFNFYLSKFHYLKYFNESFKNIPKTRAWTVELLQQFRALGAHTQDPAQFPPLYGGS